MFLDVYKTKDMKFKIRIGFSFAEIYELRDLLHTTTPDESERRNYFVKKLEKTLNYHKANQGKTLKLNLRRKKESAELKRLRLDEKDQTCQSE